MNRRFNFLFISTADWDNPFWTNKQHMAKILSDQGHKVLYFDSLGLRAPSKKSGSDKKRILRRLKKFVTGTLKVNQNLAIFSPIVIPKHNVPIIAKLNTFLLRLYIQVFKMTYFQGRDVVFWTYNPLSFDFLKGEKIVYHCVDDLTAAPGLPAEQIKKSEKRLIENSVLTFVTSKTLRDKFLDFAPTKIHYNPNVADTAHFSKANENLPKPDDLKKFKGHIIGFIGAISSYKLDFHLLKFISKSLPEVDIVLIGQVGEGQPDTSVGLIENLPNLHFLGPKDYKLLPFYLKYFDVALLPCALNDYTRSMFPMKFFEYLAADKKVVSTNLHSISEFSNCCYIATDHEDFLKGIKLALSTSVENFCNYESLRKSVLENSRDVRAEKMLKLLSQHL